MTRDKVREHLARAAERAVTVARKFVAETVPDATVFLIDPNQSFDGNPLVGDEEVFPGDSAAGRVGPVDLEGATSWLWRRGKVPEWVNVSAYDVHGEFTHVRLECCGRFTEESHLYHRREGCPPFHVLGPPVPLEWESVAKSGHVLLEGRRGNPG